MRGTTVPAGLTAPLTLTRGFRGASLNLPQGFHPIFRIEGAADNLDPEDWISATCGGAISQAPGSGPPSSAGTHNHDSTIVNNCPRSRTPVPIGIEKVFTIKSESLFTLVWNDRSRSIGMGVHLASEYAAWVKRTPLEASASMLAVETPRLP